MKPVKRLIWILIPEGFTFCSLTGKISSNQNRDMVSLTQKNKGEGLLMAGKWKLRLSAAICFGAIALGFSGCTASKPDTSGKELVVYCPHPQDFIDPIVSEFEAQSGIPVLVCSGGTGELLEQVAQGNSPRCDIFWGGSLSITSAQKQLFEPYISVNEPQIQKEFQNTEGNMTRFTDVPSVIMVNTNLIGDIPIEGYEDLLQPELKGRIAMCDPAASSSAWEHLINMLYAMGNGDPEQGWDYVEQFCENLDGKLLERSSQVYEGVARGQYAVGLTFEEGGARYAASDSPVRLVYMKEGVISTPDVVCIAKGSAHRKEAEQFVDFVTGRDAQSIIAGQLNRRSVRTDVEEPEGLPDKNSLPMLQDDLELVTERKGQWLERFAKIYEERL